MPASLLLALLLAAPAQAPAAPQAPADDFKPDPSWRRLDKAQPIWFDPKGRRVIVRARVALTDGALEHLLCRENTKEHESVLATAAVPRLMHAALLLTGAAPGHPVRFRPKFEPPAGTPIAIDLEWTEGGKARRADAKDWVKDAKTGKPLEVDWVFAGSDLFEDPETKRMIYAADGGDVITVANFPSAMLDLPIVSSAEDAERVFVANTRRIPPRGTPVTMILRPLRKPAAPKAAP